MIKSPPPKSASLPPKLKKGGGTRSSRRAFLGSAALAGPFALLADSLLPGASKKPAAGAAQPPLGTQAQRRDNLSKALAERALGTESAAPSEVIELQGPPSGPVWSAPNASPSGANPLGASESPLIRMQRELRLAMQKPMAERRWMMVIDLRKCIGCSACTVACKAENHLPPGVVYRPVIEEEIGEYPNVTRRFLPRPCMQCDNPPCTRVCPVGATYKQEDGIVVIDYEKCIGCRYCIAACPYGARYFDFGEDYTDGTPVPGPYESSPSPEYGDSWPRDGSSSPIGNVRKCQFCIHRQNAGMLPACVTTCVGGATYFGDKNDSESLVNQLVATGRAVRLKEELGTEPNVYYLV